ncbi:hypothetical protein L5515_017851 [Caenorhabditis briggsae]|uniref:Uncharacterized protein n=1 Tax=Caenorhabditis briggsae TaxID=6238 RepID=A0AAE9FFK8_CAEBR|nr:hypothetical protein L5515_017851 [Caenorhabditis briggsae]
MEPNKEPPKEWEKFDELSLNGVKISVVNEESTTKPKSEEKSIVSSPKAHGVEKPNEEVEDNVPKTGKTTEVKEADDKIEEVHVPRTTEKEIPNPLQWEKFDELSLNGVNVATVDEESTNEPKSTEKSSERTPEKAPEVEKPDNKEKDDVAKTVKKEIQDPLRMKITFESDDDEVVQYEPPRSARVGGRPPAAAAYEPRAAPIAPVPCMPIQKNGRSPIPLDVNRLEEDDGTPRYAKSSVLVNPTHVNGKVLATVYPDNIICDWIVPPHYDALSMPSILAIDVPALPGPDYISTIQTIVESSRFKLYSTIYSRIIAIWMTFWILSLTVTLLLQSHGGWPVMIWCLVWTVLLFVGIYGCAMIRRQIRIGLNHVVKKANKIIVDRHFLTGVEDRGQLSCHKVVIHFIRFNVLECRADIIRQLKIIKTGGCVFGGANQQEDPNEESIEREAAALILQYSQEYVKSVVKKRLIFPSKPIHGVSNYAPKHCRAMMCLCQFIDERHFNPKPKKWYAKYI